MSDFSYQPKKIEKQYPSTIKLNTENISNQINSYERKNIRKDVVEVIDLDNLFFKNNQPEYLNINYQNISNCFTTLKNEYQDIAPIIDEILYYISENKDNITYDGLCDTLSNSCWLFLNNYLNKSNINIPLSENDFKASLNEFLKNPQNKKRIISMLEDISSGNYSIKELINPTTGFLLLSIKKFIKDECYSIFKIDDLISSYPAAEPLIESIADYLYKNINNIEYDEITAIITDGCWKSIETSIENLCEEYLISLNDVWLVGDDLYNLSESALKAIANEDAFKKSLENFFDDSNNEKYITNLVNDIKSGNQQSAEENLQKLTNSLADYFIDEYIDLPYNPLNVEDSLKEMAAGFVKKQLDNYTPEIIDNIF